MPHLHPPDHLIPHSHAVDTASAALIAASFAGWIPTAAAIVAVVWYTIQVLESKTAKMVFKWLASRREKPEV